jgi:PPK2 family polyphosphate:nucleotide phosphotransferase
MVNKPLQLAKKCRIAAGSGFRLRDFDPAATGGIQKATSKALLAAGVERLAELQQMLYAQDHWAVLLIFQAMDAAGKDSVIAHVMSGINPTGVQVYSFKAPSPEELDHDFLWRTSRCLPERGRIGIFNRSYYEEMLVVRVHPEFLAAQRLPVQLVGKNIWKQRFEDVVAHERYLSRNGVLVRKFFLHVSREEQRRRFIARLEEPQKNWKFSLGDVQERVHWNEYMSAYEDTIRHTATEFAPWYIVPADNKWVTRTVVAAAVIEALESLDLAYPEVDASRRAELQAALAALRREGDPVREAAPPR